MINLRQKRLDFGITKILSNPKYEWKKVVSSSKGRNRYAFNEGRIDWTEYVPEKYLLTHCSIVASVNVEADGYTITSNSSKYVNHNGNAWSTPVLKAIFKSFIGAENYYEHIQVPELSKGKIIDAVLREITDGDGEKILFCDILVATDRKHEDLVRRIELGELTTLSMGCVAEATQCSRCGKIIRDNDKNCVHLDKELGKFYIDASGIQRIVAELCGIIGDEKSCYFIEASWVEKPAFTGAVLNYFVSVVPEKKSASIVIPNFEFSFDKLRVADERGKVSLKIFRDLQNKDKFKVAVNRLVNSLC